GTPTPQADTSPPVAPASEVPSRSRKAHVYAVVSLILGIGALPVAVRLSINSVGVVLAGLGALVGLYAFLVSLARRGSGIGLATLAIGVGGSVLYATWMLAGGPRGLLKDLEARMAPGEPAGEPATCRELAERLQARGMDLVWSNYRDNSICIARRDWD